MFLRYIFSRNCRTSKKPGSNVSGVIETGKRETPKQVNLCVAAVVLWLVMCMVEQIARYGEHRTLIIRDGPHGQRLLSTAPPIAYSSAVDLISHAAAHAPVAPAYQHAALSDLVTSFASSLLVQVPGPAAISER